MYVVLLWETELVSWKWFRLEIIIFFQNLICFEDICTHAFRIIDIFLVRFWIWPSFTEYFFKSWEYIMNNLDPRLHTKYIFSMLQHKKFSNWNSVTKTVSKSIGGAGENVLKTVKITYLNVLTYLCTHSTVG